MDADRWHIPLSNNKITLREGLKTMESFKLRQDDIPFSIQLTENPKYDIGLFPGYVTLQNHDTIHILLGRGVLLKDEAFVIGFTMGSTKKLNTLRERIFLLITRYLYPDGYRFYEDERKIFKSAVEIAKCMKVEDLSKLDFTKYLNYNIETIRQEVGIDTDKLRKVYALEKIMYTDPECQRLL